MEIRPDHWYGGLHHPRNPLLVSCTLPNCSRLDNFGQDLQNQEVLCSIWCILHPTSHDIWHSEAQNYWKNFLQKFNAVNLEKSIPCKFFTLSNSMQIPEARSSCSDSNEIRGEVDGAGVRLHFDVFFLPMICHGLRNHLLRTCVGTTWNHTTKSSPLHWIPGLRPAPLWLSRTCGNFLFVKMSESSTRKDPLRLALEKRPLYLWHEHKHCKG